MLKFRCEIMLMFVLGILMFSSQSEGQTPYGNSVPVWQQMRAINPYHRAQVQPVWQRYTPARYYGHAVPSARVVAVPSIQLPTPYPIVQYGAPIVSQQVLQSVPPINSFVETVPNGQFIADGSIAPAMDWSTDLAVQSGVIIGEVVLDSDVVVDPAAENELAVEAQDSFSDESLAIVDNADDDQSLLVIEDQDKQLAHNAEQLKQFELELAQKEELNQELTSRVQALEAMLNDVTKQAEQQMQAAKAANDKSQTNETQIRQALLAAKEAQKQAAWESAKSRQEAERAQEELRQLQTKAEQQQQDLMQRLRAVETKLKQASNDGEEAKPKLTLARLAEQKRKKREAEEARQVRTKPANAKKPREAAKDRTDSDKSAQAASSKIEQLRQDMEKQIERAVGKIERRFEAKIERLQEENGSKEEINKLRDEMKIQMEKMETRIRNRYEKRIEAAKKD